jgi:DNA-binding XRE family transcriptional regulator
LPRSSKIRRLPGEPREARAMTPEQCRSARAWLALKQSDLARQARVSLRTVAAFERGEITPLPNNLSALQAVFERAGLRLVFDRDGAAAGVVRHDAELVPNSLSGASNFNRCLKV